MTEQKITNVPLLEREATNAEESLDVGLQDLTLILLNGDGWVLPNSGIGQ